MHTSNTINASNYKGLYGIFYKIFIEVKVKIPNKNVLPNIPYVLFAPGMIISLGLPVLKL